MVFAEHQPVLFQEALEALNIFSGGIYVDGTFGRGGHSRGILQQIGEKGRLLALDKDPQAVAEGRRLAQKDPRFTIEHQSFAALAAVAESHEVMGQVNGVLLDLGVSSPQLDDAARGFSFLQEGPLDMRMNPAAGESAAEWLASASEAAIAQVLKAYGEERYARRIARAIVKARQEKPIASTRRLAEVIAAANPVWEQGKHPATRSFQAIRIYINDELGELRRFLDSVLPVLASAGRLVVISFHSLEDRLVKRFMREQAHGDRFPPGVPVTQDQLQPRLRLIGKAVKPSSNEIERNPRARSAVMRVAEKVA